MTSDQLEIMKMEIKKAVDSAIEAKVNGKIAALDKKVDDHMTAVLPYMEAMSGVRIIYKLFIAMGSIAVAWIAIKSLLK